MIAARMHCEAVAFEAGKHPSSSGTSWPLECQFSCVEVAAADSEGVAIVLLILSKDVDGVVFGRDERRTPLGGSSRATTAPMAGQATRWQSCWP